MGWQGDGSTVCHFGRRTILRRLRNDGRPLYLGLNDIGTDRCSLETFAPGADSLISNVDLLTRITEKASE
jgi:hypothetical protein